MPKKKSKHSPIQWWRVALSIAIIAETACFVHWLFADQSWHHLGPGALLFCIFPITVCIRLIIRNSRLSVLKALLICGAGGVMLNVWSQMSAILVYGPGADGRTTSTMGARILEDIQEAIGSPMLSYLVVTAAMFICIVLSTMKIWTALYSMAIRIF